MSKLIVEMEMPTRCGACKCRHVEFDIDYVAVFCAIKDNLYVKDPDSRPSWCPIKGVLPEEHGRLVDADACSSVLRKLENEAKTNIEKLCYGYAARMFEEAFTIIAAERKDDGNI